MPRRFLAAIALLTAPLLAPPAVAAERVVAEWRFDRPGDLRGWAAISHLPDAAIRAGALRATPSDHDPILLSPVFDIPATPDQCIEVRLQADAGDPAQLFWTHTLAGRYGGFEQERTVDFECQPGKELRVYRLYPFWHPVGKIVRLRLDPPNTGPIAIASIRILEEEPQPLSTAKSWRFDRDTAGWRSISGAPPVVLGGGLQPPAADGPPTILLSPPLRIPAAENPMLCVRMAVTAGAAARVFCVSQSEFGQSETTFELRSDRQMHSYNIDMSRLTRWRGEVIRLGIQPTDAPAGRYKIESIILSDRPQGPPELQLAYFGSADGVSRAGRPAGVVAAIHNVGGDPAADVTARLSVPPGVRLSGPAEQKFTQLTRDSPQMALWQIVAEQPGDVELALEVAAAAAEPVRGKSKLTVTAVPAVEPTDYVPAPQPVKPFVEVGVYYFPGWPNMTKWQPILDFPERRPVLGWYDEANPEVADWQIKWAAEHGVTFFMVDWYWSKGGRHLEHWLHDAYMKSRYRQHLKWAVMWANHNSPGTHSRDDWRAVTQYWIDHYFKTDEYYRIDDRPAVFIWAPRNIRQDLGGSPAAAELYAMSQEMARAAGLKGIYFVAMSSHESPAAAAELAGEGYEACTSYHAFELAAQRAGSLRFPYADVVATSEEVWRQADARAGKLLYIPVVDTGWASEPWHGPDSRVIYGRTPELFGQLCRKARDYAAAHGKPIIAVGPWNEWGEGSYIEPYAQYGFRDLDQLRSAFCPPGAWPPNLVPADVKLGPYDLPPQEWKTAWDFAPGTEDWTPNGDLELRAEAGVLVATSTGNDPLLASPAVRIDAAAKRTMVIRMKSDTADRAQLFWGTARSAPSEGSSVRFDIAGDGQFHDYRLDLSSAPAWRGTITSLRFDPVNRPGAHIAIDAIRIE